jgi:hypothetical protein
MLGRGNLPQFRFVHHKFHMSWTGLEPGLRHGLCWNLTFTFKSAFKAVISSMSYYHINYEISDLLHTKSNMYFHFFYLTTVTPYLVCNPVTNSLLNICYLQMLGSTTILFPYVQYL